MVLAVIAIGLVAVGAIGYFQLKTKFTSQPAPSQSPQITVIKPSPASTPTDETANWKTYTNTTYGFSIKYPATFAIQDKSGQFPPFAMYFLDKQRVLTGEGGNQVNPYFSVVAKPFRGSVMDYINDSNNNRIFVETKKIGDNEFVVVKEKFGMGGVANEYLLKVKGNVISISPDLIESKDSIDYKVFNQILSTFKFID